MLINIKGLSEIKVDKMVEAARKLFAGATWRSASVLSVQVRGQCMGLTACMCACHFSNRHSSDQP